jgi:hypothetical protein
MRTAFKELRQIEREGLRRTPKLGGLLALHFPYGRAFYTPKWNREPTRIIRKPAGVRQSCGGAAMANGVPRQRLQTCEPCRASPAEHQVLRGTGEPERRCS